MYAVCVNTIFSLILSVFPCHFRPFVKIFYILCETASRNIHKGSLFSLLMLLQFVCLNGITNLCKKKKYRIQTKRKEEKKTTSKAIVRHGQRYCRYKNAEQYTAAGKKKLEKKDISILNNHSSSSFSSSSFAIIDQSFDRFIFFYTYKHGDSVTEWSIRKWCVVVMVAVHAKTPSTLQLRKL